MDGKEMDGRAGTFSQGRFAALVRGKLKPCRLAAFFVAL